MSGYFYGWYLKCQSDTQTLAVIPAVHKAGCNGTCSIQIITDDNVWTIKYNAKKFRRKGKTIFIGQNCFGEKGIRLAIKTSELKIKGKLAFGPLSPLKYDIMGPFALLPFMECRHGVWSMKHSVQGKVCINGRKYFFQDACGYWEGDRGRSFPKEYRLATYLGAKVIEIGNKSVWIRQGKLELEARLIKTAHRPLNAPVQGNMVRTIHESAACQAFYRFRIAGRTLFALETDKASFEYEYPF